MGSCLGAVVAAVDVYLDSGLRGFQWFGGLGVGLNTPRRGLPRCYGGRGFFLPRLVPLLGGYLELGIVERRLNVGLGVEGAVPEECHPLFTVFACAVQGEDGIG